MPAVDPATGARDHVVDGDHGEHAVGRGGDGVGGSPDVAWRLGVILSPDAPGYRYGR